MGFTVHQPSLLSSSFGIVLTFLSVSTLTKGQTCDATHVLTEPYGTISFEGRQEYYAEEVSWKIVAPAGHNVDIEFTSFSIATCRHPQKNCQCHFLNVKDGECSNSSLMGRYCGASSALTRMSSTGRYLRLEFQSDSGDTEDYFGVSYAAAMKCPSKGGYLPKCPSSMSPNTQCCHDNSRGGCCYYDGNRCHNNATNMTRDYCPRVQDNRSRKICCVADGELSCCISGGKRCSGNVTSRDYCPGPSNDSEKTTCCSFQGEETCCLPGGNICHDEGANIRSYCPSPDHSSEETVCCSVQGKPSCCTPKPPPPACVWFLQGKSLNNAACITIWAVLALVALVGAILSVMACIKWQCYHCLYNPLCECLEVLGQRLARLFNFLVRTFKTVLFYASLVVTTIVFTFVCCICFMVIQRWPWVEAYRTVSPAFDRTEIPRCCPARRRVEP